MTHDPGIDRDTAAFASGRSARAELVFAQGGGKTILTRQFVPYPFHMTRPFRLDRERPGLATLYLQSASGGLYRGDDLALSLRAVAGAQAHVTTQAGTIVHDTAAFAARQRLAIHVERGAFLAYTPDPLVLLPGAGFVGETTITLEPGGAAIVSDGFAFHDIEAGRRPFDRLSQCLTINDGAGRRLVREKGTLRGEHFVAAASPLGPYRAAGTTLVLTAASPELLRLREAAEATGCVVGVGLLPNGAGSIVRCLAADGGTLREGLAAVFAEAFHGLVGVAPAPRPK